MELNYRNPPRPVKYILGELTMATALFSEIGNLLTENPNHYLTALFVGIYFIGAATKSSAVRRISSDNLESRI